MSKIYEWAVIGAGPAGIASVGQLMDHGIHSDEILWLDPEFKVGDFGTKWADVSSNTKVELFTRFFESCRSFKYGKAPNFSIQTFNPNDTCLLQFAAEPLQWVTNHLTKKVNILKDKVVGINLSERKWHLQVSDQVVKAKNVIVAPGSEPLSLNYPSVSEILLTEALKSSRLKQHCHSKDRVAVFGSSHSAILLLKELIENCKVEHVYNFFRSPLCYATYFDDWILFDDKGLKGKAAEWARENIDGKLPKNLTRLLSNENNIRSTLPLCTKVIYATGFKSRSIPIEGMNRLEYNNRNGIIAPGLFGLGIAFPEAREDYFGTIGHRVGLWKFMDYLVRVMPIWLKYGC